MKPCRCLLGLHSWSNCRCTRCGWVRNRDKPRHDFAAVDGYKHACQDCGLIESHTFTAEMRWEDWGGWDSVGPWRAQENEYRVCRDCGYERSSTTREQRELPQIMSPIGLRKS